jgi:hypothetical protein
MAGEQPRDEREVKGEIGIHTPTWLPGVKASLSMRRLYDKRSEKFLRDIQQCAHLTDEDYVERVAEGDEIAGLMAAAGERVASSGSKYLSDTFASLIAAAMLDDARIDDVSYILPKLLNLQAVHIRIIASLVYMPHGFTAEDLTRGDSSWHGRVTASTGVVSAALTEVESSGFVETIMRRVGLSEDEYSHFITASLEKQPGFFTPTEIGKFASNFINSAADELSAARDLEGKPNSQA